MNAEDQGTIKNRVPKHIMTVAIELTVFTGGSSPTSFTFQGSRADQYLGQAVSEVPIIPGPITVADPAFADTQRPPGFSTFSSAIGDLQLNYGSGPRQLPVGVERL